MAFLFIIFQIGVYFFLSLMYSIYYEFMEYRHMFAKRRQNVKSS